MCMCVYAIYKSVLNIFVCIFVFLLKVGPQNRLHLNLIYCFRTIISNSSATAVKYIRSPKMNTNKTKKVYIYKLKFLKINNKYYSIE